MEKKKKWVNHMYRVNSNEKPCEFCKHGYILTKKDDGSAYCSKKKCKFESEV